MVWLGDADWGVGMPVTLKLQTCAQAAIRGEHVNDFLPHWNIIVSVRVSNNVHAMFCTGQQNINAVGSAEKSTLPLQVTPHERDDDDFCFLTLEVINGCSPDALEKSCFARLFRLDSGRSCLAFAFELFQFCKVTVVEANLKHGFHSAP
jgi:hypothetical protein